jgi:transcriptional regulator with XRE-family HTH domain
VARRKSREEQEADERLGREIERLRKSRGLTRRELAAQLGVTRQGLFWIEVGRSSCSASRLQQIANALEVPIARLSVLLSTGC